MPHVIIPFFKSWSSCKSVEEQLPVSGADRSSSVWSYSYDLNLIERFGELSQNISIDSNVESRFEDKLSLKSICNADLDNEFILKGSAEIRQTPVGSKGGAVIENLNQNSQESKQEYRRSEPQKRRSYNQESKIKAGRIQNSIERLSLAEMQYRRSWLSKIIQPTPEEMNDESKYGIQGRNSSQIKTSIIYYLQEFIKETALPAMQELDSLQKEYSRETKKWKSQIEYLERQNSLLKAELEDGNRFHKYVEKVPLNSKIKCRNKEKREKMNDFLFTTTVRSKWL